MKRLLVILALTVAVAGCASSGMRDADRLAMYRAHAGPPIDHFNYFGSINGWTPLGDRALTVWTRPATAYLLELTGPCPDLDFAPAISISNQMGRVHARFDKIRVHGGATRMDFPCRIGQIRPIDVKALRQTERELRRVDAIEREAERSG